MEIAKRALFSLLLLAPIAAFAAPSHLSSRVSEPILCRGEVDPYAILVYLDKYAGKPYKKEGGAHWFKVKAFIGTLPIEEIFVSEQGMSWRFVGAISTNSAQDAAREIQNSLGISFKAISYGLHPVFRATTGSTINHYGEKAKILCLHYRR